MVPNLSTAADIPRDLVLISDIGGDGQRLRRGRQIPDRGFELRFIAIDCDNTRAAFGQQPHRRGADNAGRPGDDGDLAIQTNSIGHVWRFPCCSGCPGSSWFGVWRANVDQVRLFHLGCGLTSGRRRAETALSPPYSPC
jgi:hypothetical protein